LVSASDAVPVGATTVTWHMCSTGSPVRGSNTWASRCPPACYHETLIKRLSIIARHGRIEKVFYPVFPPDTHAEDVIAWLKKHSINL
jgi:hypothetical protein